MKKLSPAEYDEFMRQKYLKDIEMIPKTEKGFIVGSYFDLYFNDNCLVECACCGIPLYVRPWVLAVSKERNWPIACLYCAPAKVVKGRLVQDIAAVLQHTGEK
jgi:hypothetical protein